MNAGHGLRLVTRTAEEEAAIVRPSPTEDAKAATNFATWKFVLIETVGADPMATPFCLAVIVSYLHFINRETRTAYLSENDLRVRTDLHPPILRKAKRLLARLGYITSVGKTKAGVHVYRIDNPRRELVAEHMVFAAETLKELEAQKKDDERRRLRRRGARLDPPGNAKGGQDSTLTGGHDPIPNPVEQPVDNNLSEGSGFNRSDPWGVLASVDREMASIRGGMK